jgi:hypothetical protein
MVPTVISEVEKDWAGTSKDLREKYQEREEIRADTKPRKPKRTTISYDRGMIISLEMFYYEFYTSDVFRQIHCLSYIPTTINGRVL